MNNKKFKTAIGEALSTEYENCIPKHDEHIFSEKFEKKMNTLIRRQNKSYYKFINTAFKRVACVIAAIVISSSIAVMSVEALRNTFYNFFVEIFEKFSIITTVDDTSTPKKIDELYEITYDLDNYSINYEEQNDSYRSITYVDGSCVINYYQYTKDYYDTLVNTEDADIVSIQINGNDGIYFIDNHKYNHIIWDNGEYIIYLSSNIDKNKLIEIADSVQKVD
jgi:hypothetical protein